MHFPSLCYLSYGNPQSKKINQWKQITSGKILCENRGQRNVTEWLEPVRYESWNKSVCQGDTHRHLGVTDTTWDVSWPPPVFPETTKRTIFPFKRQTLNSTLSADLVCSHFYALLFLSEHLLNREAGPPVRHCAPGVSEVPTFTGKPLQAMLCNDPKPAPTRRGVTLPFPGPWYL